MRVTWWIAAALLVYPGLVAAQSWNSSPNNWNNSANNWNNSPNNWNNSPNNMSSRNGIYDGDGNRTGYAVRRPDGGVNFFDNGGNRRGYRPSDDD